MAKESKKRLLIAAAVITLISASAFAGKKSRTFESVPGEFLVKFKNASGLSVQAVAIGTLSKVLGAGEIESASPLATDSKLYKVKLKKSNKVGFAIRSLSANSSVAYAEPNYIFHKLDDTTEPVAGVPNDSDFAKLWGMKNTGQTDTAGQIGLAGSDINVMPLWTQGITGSKNITVAVIDTGVDWTHPDLEANIYTNHGEEGALANDGIDNDGNGFIDDVHGWNFVDNTKNSQDDHDHGSHCSGTIGGVGNNGAGVAGVNWNVSILPVKFLDAEGSGTLEAAVNSINYATKMKVNVMSNSWGGGGFTQSLYDAIEASQKAGILFVAAAGNETNNNDSSATYPAGYEIDNVLAVAAIDNKDKIANFSNWGSKTVHVAAPGVKIYSTVKGGGYDTFSGTSMATPHVAGVAALVLSGHAGMTYAELKERLIKTSAPVRGLKNRVVAKGRVSAFNAYNNIVPPTNEPDPSQWVAEPVSYESIHPYKENMKTSKTITVPGATHLRVVFEKIETEQDYDFVEISSKNGEVVDAISGSQQNYVSEYVDGDSVTISFNSDYSDNAWGFKVVKIEAIGATAAPIVPPGDDEPTDPVTPPDDGDDGEEPSDPSDPGQDDPGQDDPGQDDPRQGDPGQKDPDHS